MELSLEQMMISVHYKLLLFCVIFALMPLMSKGLIEGKRLKIGLLLPFTGRRPMGLNAAGTVTLALDR